MSQNLHDFLSEVPLTGPCTINIDNLQKRWDHRFVLSQYGEEFQLIKYTRRGSGSRDVKVTISREQAQEIIDRLKLVQCKDSFFVRASTWRPEGMSEYDMLRIPKEQEC